MPKISGSESQIRTVMGDYMASEAMCHAIGTEGEEEAFIALKAARSRRLDVEEQVDPIVFEVMQHEAAARVNRIAQNVGQVFREF